MKIWTIAKRGLSLVLAAVVLAAMLGCGADGGESSSEPASGGSSEPASESSSSSREESSSEDSGKGSPLRLFAPGLEPGNELEPISESAPEPESVKIKYVNGRDFSDGVAWVQTEEEIWHCVDKSGKILFKLESEEDPSSDFSNGVALVWRPDRTMELVDKTGSVISSPESGDYDSIVEFLPDLGMILVRKHIETFEITENRAGIIDSKGNWVIELTNDEKILALTSSFSGISYRRDGWFFQNFGYDYMEYAYNALTGEFLNFQGFVVSLRSDEYGELECLGGNSFRLIKGEDIDQQLDFTASQAMDFFIDIKEMNTDNLYYTPIGIHPSYSTALIDGAGFYDAYYNKAIDLSEYDLTEYNNYVNVNPKFSDGFYLLCIKNPQGSPFFTVIDETGKRMFEPKSESLLVSGIGNSIKCGLIRILEDGKVSFINTSGDTVIDVESVGDSRIFEVTDFYEDVARITAIEETEGSGGERYIYYIDKTGERLF
jgi:hypothetical protein